MKAIFIFVLIFHSVLCFSQDTTYLGKKTSMKMNFNAQKCDAVGKTSEESTILKIDTKIRIVAFTKKAYVVKSEESKTEEYFLIPFPDLNEVVINPASCHRFFIGIPTLPVKLRFSNSQTNNFRFDSNLNLGTSVGYKYYLGRKHQTAINFIVGFSLSSITLDSETTNGKQTSTTTPAAFSPHFGILMDIQQFQIGIYTGIDYLNGNQNDNWVYKDKPWIGIGIGLSLFTLGKDK